MKKELNECIAFEKFDKKSTDESCDNCKYWSFYDCSCSVAMGNSKICYTDTQILNYVLKHGLFLFETCDVQTRQDIIVEMTGNGVIEK